MRGRVALSTVGGALILSASLVAQQAPQGAAPQGRGAAPAPAGRGAAPAGRAAQAPPTPRAQAPIDITGYWVAVISEDWRWRMITPAKGDFPSIPMTLEAEKIAEAWDPAKDEAAGEQCRAYGAPGLIRGPIRMHITWLDDQTLKVETDYGMQTRLMKFGNTGGGTPNSWQGVTTAQWQMAGGGRGRGGQRYGTLKTVTSQLKPGYLRKNGVPYSNKAVLTEYWDLLTEANGDKYLLDTNIVEDPVYLQLPFTTAIHYKQEKDGSKYDPTPCDARF